MIRRTVFALLGAVELAVDAYDWLKRLVTRRETPIPLKPKPAPAAAKPTPRVSSSARTSN